MTCFNRRDTTLVCLHSLEVARSAARVEAKVFLVDDGCTDGTREAVVSRFPATSVLPGGDLFWNRGTHRAFAAAMVEGYDYYLWLNDDTRLHPDSLVRLLGTHRSISERLGPLLIVVGSVCDAQSGRPTYGGMVRPAWWKRTRLELRVPGPEPIECETMNGNCVLIPRAVADRVGNLDPVFEHAMGDTDYGLRARALGVRIFMAPGFVGTCARDSSIGTFKDTTLPLSQRWRLIRSRKGLPEQSWLHYTRRHAGPLWFLFFAWPYLRVVLSSLFRGKVLR